MRGGELVHQDRRFGDNRQRDDYAYRKFVRMIQGSARQKAPHDR